MEAWLLKRFDATTLDESISKVDSLSLLEVSYDLEDEFGVKIDFTTFPKNGTLRDILKYMETHGN